MRVLGLLTLCMLAATAADLRLGIIGTDTSHVIEFTELLNDHSSPGSRKGRPSGRKSGNLALKTALKT